MTNIQKNPQYMCPRTITTNFVVLGDKERRFFVNQLDFDVDQSLTFTSRETGMGA